MSGRPLEASRLDQSATIDFIITGNEFRKRARVKTVEVVAAIIKKDGKILATQRGYGDLEGGWEFPGGKIEPGEAPEEALVREIMEELRVAINVESYLYNVEYDYEKFHLSMRCYVCTLIDEDLVLTEHHAARWLDRKTIDSVAWLPADIEVVEAIKAAQVI